MNDPVVPSFEQFLAAITQTLGDPTFSVLKAHLLFEEMLNAFVWKVLPNADALRGARLTFAQRLAVSRACLPPHEDGWHWEALTKLNGLRNQLSHHLLPKERDKRIAEYVSFVTASLGIPLPSPFSSPGRLDPERQHGYLAVDMANAGLFAVMCDRFGLSDPARW